MVLTFDGELCDTRFSKCCGGVFEVFETCWDDTPRPYLQPRRDGVDPTDFPDLTVEENAVSWILGKPEAFCNTTDRRVLSQVLNGYDRETPDFYRWTETLPQEKITRLVADRLGEDLGRILSLTPLTRGTSGRIRELKITGTKGERIIGKELMIRRTLSDSHLYSSAFVVEPLAGSRRHPFRLHSPRSRMGPRRRPVSDRSRHHGRTRLWLLRNPRPLLPRLNPHKTILEQCLATLCL